VGYGFTDCAANRPTQAKIYSLLAANGVNDCAAEQKHPLRVSICVVTDCKTHFASATIVLETADELRSEVGGFMEGGNAEMAQLSATYGLPIGTWCVSNIQDFSLHRLSTIV
jgi:hypothetical protein